MQKKILQKFVILSFLVLLNCTTVGFHDDKIRNSINFGEPQTLNVCVLYENTIDKSEVTELEYEWAKELSLYKINLKFSKTQKVERFAFFGKDVLDQLLHYKLSPDCHRIVYMVGRTWGDIGFEILSLGIFVGIGIKLEVHGAVETRTNTRGYVKSKYASLLQILFTSPSSTLIHEGYHLLGCPHMLWKDECYKIIQEAKNKNFKVSQEDKIFSVRSVYNHEQFFSSEKVNSLWGSEKEFLEDNIK